MRAVHAGSDACLGDPGRPALARVRCFFEAVRDDYRKQGYPGCLMGRIGQELSGGNAVFRRKTRAQDAPDPHNSECPWALAHASQRGWSAAQHPHSGDRTGRHGDQAIALRMIAVRAGGHQVVERIGAAAALRDQMVDGERPERMERAAAEGTAPTALVPDLAALDRLDDGIGHQIGNFVGCD
jgi:hypothetical protein